MHKTVKPDFVTKRSQIKNNKGHLYSILFNKDFRLVEHKNHTIADNDNDFEFH
jgi:hypothetical protein